MKDLFDTIENKIKENFEIINFKEFTKYWVWTVKSNDNGNLKIRMDKPVISFSMENFDGKVGEDYRNFKEFLKQEEHLVL